MIVVAARPAVLIALRILNGFPVSNWGAFPRSLAAPGTLVGSCKIPERTPVSKRSPNC